MNLFEYENSVFGNVWTEQAIKELKEYKPPEGTGTTEHREFECYEGRYLASQMQW